MEPSPGELWAGLGPWVPASHTRVPDASCRPRGVRILCVGAGETQCAGGGCGPSKGCGPGTEDPGAEKQGAAGQAHSVPLVPRGTLAVWPCWLWTQVGGRQWAWRAEEGAQAAPGAQ